MSTYKVDPSHSDIVFRVRHMMVGTVHGQFRKWEAQMSFDPKDPKSDSVLVAVDVDSIDTREPKRDTHLKSADFFDLANHPTMTFESTHVVRASAQKYEVTGNLTIRGTQKSVVLAVEHLGGGKDPWGEQRAIFNAKVTVDRRDFGLVWNLPLDAGGVLVGNVIEIDIDIEAIVSA